MDREERGPQPTDSELLLRFVVLGEEDAFTHLVERHGGLVLGVARRMLAGSADAEDVAQRVFVVFAGKARELTRVASLGAWLHRAAMLECLKAKREFQRRRERIEIMKAQARTDAGPGGEPAADLAHLDEALQGLRSADRELLLQHYVEGRTFAEIGAQGRGSAEAVRKRVRRALDRLAVLLGRRGTALPAVVLGSLLGSELGKAAPIGLAGRWAARSLELAGGQGGSAVAAGFVTAMKTGKLTILGAALLAAAVPIGLETARSVEAEGRGLASPPVTVETGAGGRASEAERASAGVRDQLLDAFRRLEAGEEVSPVAERSLRRLIFTLDATELATARELLENVEKHERFYEVALAVYARWAELDPEAALAAANESMNRYGYYPLRGAFGTWAERDPEAAREWLVRTEGSRFDLQHLAWEWVRRLVQSDPSAARALQEQLGAERAEWDLSIRHALLAEWSKSAPRAALAWLDESLAEADVLARDEWFGKWVEAAGDGHPEVALAFAERIVGPGNRAEAMWDVVWPWGMHRPDELAAFLQTSEGFPQWDPKVTRSVAEALTRHRPEVALALAERLDSGARKDAYLGGMLSASSFVDPAPLLPAADALSDEYVEHEDSGAIMAFLNRLVETDPAMADAWVAGLPEGPKKRIAAMTLKIAKNRGPAAP